jgi:cytochrome c oxidase subunit 1
MYFWWPKAFGYMLNEKLGKWHFWVFLLGFNLTFGPMHILGLQGMSRRIFTYSANQGFDFWNMVCTIGAYMIAVGSVIFLVNVIRSYREHKRNPVDVGPDPWDARSLEWSIPSPAPEYNFAEIPTVTELDDFWHRKYGHDEDGRLVKIADVDEVAQKGGATDIHLPSPSYWPLVLACGFPFLGYGVIFHLGWAVLGLLIIVVALYGWVMEPSTDPDAGHGHAPHEHGGSDDQGVAAELEPEEGEASSEEGAAKELEEAPVG